MFQSAASFIARCVDTTDLFAQEAGSVVQVTYRDPIAKQPVG
jgi:hypothetical protein